MEFVISHFSFSRSLSCSLLALSLAWTNPSFAGSDPGGNDPMAESSSETKGNKLKRKAEESPNSERKSTTNEIPFEQKESDNEQGKKKLRGKLFNLSLFSNERFFSDDLLLIILSHLDHVSLARLPKVCRSARQDFSKLVKVYETITPKLNHQNDKNMFIRALDQVSPLFMISYMLERAYPSPAHLPKLNMKWKSNGNRKNKENYMHFKVVEALDKALKAQKVPLLQYGSLTIKNCKNAENGKYKSYLTEMIKGFTWEKIDLDGSAETFVEELSGTLLNTKGRLNTSLKDLQVDFSTSDQFDAQVYNRLLFALTCSRVPLETLTLEWANLEYGGRAEMLIAMVLHNHVKSLCLDDCSIPSRDLVKMIDAVKQNPGFRKLQINNHNGNSEIIFQNKAQEIEYLINKLKEEERIEISGSLLKELL